MAARPGEIYGGAWGRTRTEALHVTCSCGTLYAADVHRSVNATRDPALGGRLREGTLGETRCPGCGGTVTVEVPVVYHDEVRRLFILVMPLSMRHRELEERAELYLALARERGFAVPAYVRELKVAFGAAELARAIERPIDAGADTALAERIAELDRRAAELDRREAELAELASPLDIEQVEAEPTEAMPGDAQMDEKALFGDLREGGHVHTVVEDSTDRFGVVDGMAPLARDGAAARWISARTGAGHTVDRGDVRLLLRARPAGGALQVRVLLARLPTYPLLAIAVGPGGVGDEEGEPLATVFDVENDEDRQALALLTASFHLVVDFFDDAYQPIARREVILPLAGNVRYAQTLADEHLRQIPGARRSFDAAVAAWRAPGFDRWGRREPRLEEDSFSLLPTPAAAQKALGVVAGWSEPDNEDYLLLTRSFPLEWWRRIRARVIHRGVELGLVLPGVLADVAVSEGLYRSRKELVARTLAAFAALVGARDGSNDLDADQIAANWRALFILCDEEAVAVDSRIAELARSAGLAQALRPPLVVVKPRGAELAPSMGDLMASVSSSAARAMVRPASSSTSMRSARDETGRIAMPLEAPALRREPSQPVPAVKPDFRSSTSGELVEMLDDKDLRLSAAIELCRRVDVSSVGPIFGAVRRMTRGEAVRVLPAAIKFGERAVAHMVDLLRTRKAYLRQGSALALGILKSGDGIDPLCELLLGEPTDIWREVARALGEIGGGAVMSLAARLRDPEAQGAEARERIAWALAHVVGKGAGGKSAVETLAAGRDPTAATAARRALELSGSARDNDAEVRGPVPPRDQTVNRAFSRRFFEALGVAPPRASEDASGSVELDDEELLDADEEVIEDEDILPS